MNYWRLISRKGKEHQEKAARTMVEQRQISIGWGGVGDFDRLKGIESEADLTPHIRAAYSDEPKAVRGTSSIWSFWRTMQIGDIVIIRGNNKNLAIVRVTGDYRWVGHCHVGSDHFCRRDIEPIDIEPDDLWQRCGAFPKGKIGYETLVLLPDPIHDRSGANALPLEDRVPKVYSEGATAQALRRFHTRNAALIKNKRATLPPDAPCEACGFAYPTHFNPPISANLDLHHKDPIAERDENSTTTLDDLILLCPNCHRATHSFDPPLDLATLKSHLSN